LLKLLLELVNASVREGTFPSTLKKSVVKPIYKKGMKEDANNYHPITLASALSQILKNHQIYFLDKHNILNKSLYRFGKN
jgi:hypothetical protein